MSLLTYTNPSGATNTFPFPTDGSRKIYYQEVNNMFEQVRAHINGNIGPANFEQPFATSLSWDIGVAQKALDIASISTQATVDITHSTNALANDTGVVSILSSAVSNDTTSLLRIHSNSAGSSSWPIHIISDKASGDISVLRFSPNMTASYWTVVRDSNGNIKHNIPTGSKYDWSINGISQLMIASEEISTPFNMDALSFTAGNTVLQDGNLSFGDTADIIKEGTDTVVIGEKVRIKDVNGPRLSSRDNNELLLENSVRIENVNGPKLSKGTTANNSLQVEDQLEFTATNPVVIKKNSTNKGLAVISDGGNSRTAVVGSNEADAFKIYRARINMVTGAVVAGSEITFVSLPYAPSGGAVRLRVTGIVGGTAGTQVSNAPIIQLVPWWDGTPDFGVDPMVGDIAVTTGQCEFTIYSVKGNKDALNLPGDLRAEAALYMDVTVIARRGD